jgi:hypothetical protein
MSVRVMSNPSELWKKLRAYRPGRSAVLLVDIWVLGLLALDAVFAFEGRADATQRAEVVIAQLRNEQGSLLAVAFSPAITPGAPRPEQTAVKSPRRSGRTATL